VREGAVTGKMAAAVAVLFAIAAGCMPAPTPVGGLMVSMDIDATLIGSRLDHLSVAVSSLDGTKTYRDAGYPIDGPDATVRFPTTLFIESNGDPAASVAIALGLWDAGEPIDVREYRVTGIPTQRVATLTVLFDAHECAPEVRADQILPGCTSSLAGMDLPTYGADAGPAPFRVIDAGRAESSGADASDAGLADATVEDAESGAAPLDASDEGAADGSIAPIPPCDPACAEGQTHCVDGACRNVPPSCLGGGPGAGFNCGGSNGTDDCCGSLRVPLTSQGTFFRDYQRGIGVPNGPDYPASVSQFRLDVYEVTVGRFRKFVDAVVGGDAAAPWIPQDGWGKHTHLNGGMGLVNGGEAGTVYESGWDSSWNTYLPTKKAGWDSALLEGLCYGDAFPPSDTWTNAVDKNENLPLNCLNWYEAYAFCIWDGGFLPSRTEWNYAAAGGSEQRVYAWGDAPLNVDYAIYNCYYGAGPFGNNCLGVGNIAPVGSVPSGRGLWGQLDLTGNVYEWTLDYLAAYPLPCQDCASTATGSLRIVRGGGFSSQPTEIQNAWLYKGPPESVHADVGMRCARAP
jgi:formylglycine-generating enzyme required for sulfatase activity